MKAMATSATVPWVRPTVLHSRRQRPGNPTSDSASPRFRVRFRGGPLRRSERTQALRGGGDRDRRSRSFRFRAFLSGRGGRGGARDGETMRQGGRRTKQSQKAYRQIVEGGGRFCQVIAKSELRMLDGAAALDT